MLWIEHYWTCTGTPLFSLCFPIPTQARSLYSNHDSDTTLLLGHTRLKHVDDHARLPQLWKPFLLFFCSGIASTPLHKLVSMSVIYTVPSPSNLFNHCSTLNHTRWCKGKSPPTWRNIIHSPSSRGYPSRGSEGPSLTPCCCPNREAEANSHFLPRAIQQE